MTCEWFVAWFGAFRGHVRDALHHHINNMNICCQKLARSDYLRRLKNGTKVSSAKSGQRQMRDTTHGAYTIPEYNQVYAGLICNTLYRKLGTAGLLTNDVKPLIASRGFDCTKYNKVITELWKQLEFFAWFLLQDVLQGQWVKMQ